MARGDQLSRQWKIIQTLISSRTGKSAADVAGYIKEKIWHESQQIHPQDDGSIIFEAQVAGMDEIKFWIMNWGSNALVLEPESLRYKIKTEAEVMLKNYSEDVVKEEKPQIA